MHCLALLETVPADACFFFQSTPPTLIPARGRKAGSQVAATLVARLTRAQQLARTRADEIRLQTLLVLSRLGAPIPLWQLVLLGPLPATAADLVPRTVPAVSRQPAALTLPEPDAATGSSLTRD